MSILNSTPVVMGEGQGEDGAAGKPSDCTTGKKSYATEEQAEEFSEFLLRNHNTLQRAYKCDQCASWHLTSSEVGDHGVEAHLHPDELRCPPRPVLSQVWKSLPEICEKAPGRHKRLVHAREILTAALKDSRRWMEDARERKLWELAPVRR